MQWEMIDRFDDKNTERAKIPGGWLVRFWARSGYDGQSGLTFVPDPKHEWDGKSIK